jgi:hypothetical protein
VVEMTEKMKALGNDFIEKCENQGLTFEEMKFLLMYLSTRTDEALERLQKHHLTDDVTNIRRF